MMGTSQVEYGYLNGFLSDILSLRGVQWVAPQSMAALLKWWKDWNVKPEQEIIWNCIPFAVMWTIWIKRNNLIFENKCIEWEEVPELIKMRVALCVVCLGSAHPSTCLLLEEFWESCEEDGANLPLLLLPLNNPFTCSI
ncbi:hypothetical protein RHSIM_Rhsim12G0011400 [Rhododendron simsii]|uniref:Uncharacterized protein n=1 Tax=Rhododendron simsii TaxID=118357 RepID=A0A834G3W3_RHOSS|nr:hypothetical protein RHSIM_Rhsim12G0011400 [Rhododendron simsii]